MSTIDNAIVRGWTSLLGENSTLLWLTNTWWKETIDPRTNGYFLIDISHISICIIMIIYALLVWLFIPMYMHNRQPFNVKKCLIFYDFVMIAMNLYFFTKTLQLSNWGREMFKWQDTSNDWSAKAFRYIDIAHLYYLSKLVDMLDTFFMAFRKRYSQISFLHVWHHVSLSYAGWLYCRYNPYTPSILIIPLMNTVIHMIMYAYYGFAALGPQYQKYLWWKKYITRIQLLQFTVVFIWYICIFFAKTNLPIGYIWCNLGNSAFLFGLFFNFYIQAYRAQKKETNKIQ